MTTHVSPDDIVWRTPLLHPPRAHSDAELLQNSHGGLVEAQVGARCLEMAGGGNLEWRIVVSERTVPDGKQEVRIRNSKLSSAISQPLLPPVALDPTGAAAAAGGFSSNNSSIGGARLHTHAACLSLCIVPDLHHPQKTTLWCGWSSGHISVHFVGGKNAGEIVECFLAHRGGGPVRMLKSMSCERNGSGSGDGGGNFAAAAGGGGGAEALLQASERGVDATISRVVMSASSEFSVTLWDSQSMRPLKTVQLGAAIGMVRSICLDMFLVYSNETNQALLKHSLAVVGADNGNLIVLDVKKEIVGAAEVAVTDPAAAITSPRGPRSSPIALVHQRAAVTSLAAIHFPGAAPSVCISGSEGGVLRAQTLAVGTSATASSTLSLQHGAIHSIALLPTSALPRSAASAVTGSSNSSVGGGHLLLAACASGRIFLLMISPNTIHIRDRPNNNDLAPHIAALASFMSPTGPVVQLCCRPGWCRAVYAVTANGAVDLYSSTEAVLSKMGSAPSSLFSSALLDASSSASVVVAPQQLKAKTMSLVMQSERRYEQNLHLLLELAASSRRHCEGRDGAILRLQEEAARKDQLLDAVAKQCESLTGQVEQLRADNKRLAAERSAIMDHSRAAASGGAAARHDAEVMARDLQAATERETNTAALMDAMRMRVISLERELDRSLTTIRAVEGQLLDERSRSEHLRMALLDREMMMTQQKPPLLVESAVAQS